jgi:probable HAF family extracellular repeat protein
MRPNPSLVSQAIRPPIPHWKASGVVSTPSRTRSTSTSRRARYSPADVRQRRKWWNGSRPITLGNNHGFIYSDGNYKTLDDPLGVQGTVAEGINDKGQIVGYYTDANGHTLVFLYSDGSYTTLNAPAAVDIYPNAINNNGQIAGYYYDGTGASHGFVATVWAVGECESLERGLMKARRGGRADQQPFVGDCAGWAVG